MTFQETLSIYLALNNGNEEMALIEMSRDLTKTGL